MSSPKTNFVIEDLISKIFQNNYRNSKLPPERELAEQYHVSRHTIQKALRQLKIMMLLSSQQGNGVFVNEKMRRNPMVYNSMTLVPYSEIQSQIISLEKIPASTEFQRIFNVPGNSYIWKFKRVRITSHKKTQIETGYLPCSLFPSMTADIIEDSIQDFAIEEGYRISHFLTKYSCTQLNREEAELLNSRKNASAFFIKSRGFLKDGSVFVSSKIVAIDYECTYVVPFNKYVFHRRRKF